MQLAKFLSDFEARIAGDCDGPSGGRRNIAVGLWAMCVCALALAIWKMGFPVVWEKLNDVLVLLDGAWRVWNGQVPHRDFYSVVGPYPMGVFALGFALNRHDITGFPWALLLTGFAFSALSWRISEGRLTIWWRLVVAIQVLLLPSAVNFLGGGEDLGGGKGPPFGFAFHTTYAMEYNRLGWTVLLLQMLLMLIPRRAAETPRQIFQDAVLAGVVMGFGIFCKVSYLLACIGLAGWWIACSDRRGRRIVGLCIGFALVTALLAIYPGGVVDYFMDQWRLLRVSRSESHVASLLLRVQANLGWIVLLTALHISIFGTLRMLKKNEQLVWWLVRFVVAMGVCMFVTTFNTQRGEVPGFLIVGLITVEMVLRSRQSGANAPDATGLSAVDAKSLVLKICCVALAASEFCYDGGSVLYAAAWKWRKPNWADESERFAGLLSPLPVPVFFNEPTERAAVERAIVQRRSGPWINTGKDYFMTSRQTARWVNDGVDLLKDHIRPTDRIFVTAWFNPFNLAFGLPPAKGGAMHWDYDRVVDDRIHPDVQRTLAEVTIFMVPKRSDWQEQRDFMLKWYGQGLGTDFHVVGESQFWTCWRR